MTSSKTERLSLEKLRGLASAAPPCISIVLVEREARDARVTMKKALAAIRAKLSVGASKHEVDSLLEPLELEAASAIDSSKEPATFIFLRSPEVCESFRTPYLIGQSVTAVDQCFRLRPLLALASKQLDFYILALQLNDTRIFKCTEQRCDAVRFPKRNGEETAGFASGASKLSLHAEPVHDRDHPENHLRRFYRELDRDVNDLLRDGHPPLVVVGVEHEIALFHRLTTYPAFVEPGIQGLPGRLGKDEMHRQCLELVRSATTGQTRQHRESFDKEVGTGHASADLREVLRAASAGRVQHLYLLDIGTAATAADGGADLFDMAAVETLRHGGDVQTLPGTNMPSGSPICAIFRYAAAGS